MYKKIYILLTCILTHCFVAAQEDIKIFFYVDGSLVSIPTSILNVLEVTPPNEIDQVLIKQLIHSGAYDSVETNQYIDSKQETFFVATGKKSQKIQSITLHGVNKDVQYQLQHLVDLEVGSVYTPEMNLRLEKKLARALQDSGYRNAQIVDIQTETATNGFININVYVNSGNICMIEQIVMPTGYLAFISFFNFPLDIGSPCNISQVNDALQQIQESYWSDGYLQAVVEIDHIEYTRNQEKAIIYVKVDLGKKTILKVVDHSLNIFKSDFLDPKAGGLTYSDLISLSDSELRNAIIDFYQKQGYASVKVSPPKRYNDKNGDHIISFEVTKGPPARVNQIFFLGDSLPLPQEDIEKEIELTPGIIFNKDYLEQYKEKFKKILYRYGYNDAIVDDLDFYFSPDKTLINVIIKYEKFTQYIVESIAFAGFEKYIPNSNNIEGYIIDISNTKFDHILKSGSPLDIEKKQEIGAELREMLMLNGYLYAAVEEKVVFDKKDPPDPQTPVHIIYEANHGPVARIRNIYVEGDTFRKDAMIISISNLRSGEIFTQKKLDNAVKEILKHVLFTSVAIDFKDPKTLEKKLSEIDLVIKVRGRKGLNFSLSPVYGTGTGYRANANFNVNNLTPHGLRLTLDAGVRQEVQQQDFELSSTKQILGQTYTVGLTEPLFKFFSLQTPIDMTLLGGYQVVAEALLNRRITTFNLFGEWKPTLWGANVNLALSLDQNNYVSLSPPNTAIAVFDSPVIMLRDISPKLTIDARNNSGWPTYGFLLNGLFGFGSFAFGSDVQYNNFNINYKQYFPIYKKLSGAVYLGLSQTNGVKNQNKSTITPPESLRTYLVDDALIRGFPENYTQTPAGPLLWLHAQNPSSTCANQLQLVGGTRMMYLKVEGRYRINENFGLVAFGDSGTTYFPSKQANRINTTLAGLPPPVSPIGSPCTFDQASLVSNPPIDSISDFLSQYWNRSYISTGVGVRVILGSYMTVNLDYGYPLRDPAEQQSGCMTIDEALSSNVPPICVKRIQTSTFIFQSLQYKGTFNFTIEATL